MKRLNFEDVKQWTKDHKTEIVFGSIAVVLGLKTIHDIAQEKKNDKLFEDIREHLTFKSMPEGGIFGQTIRRDNGSEVVILTNKKNNRDKFAKIIAEEMNKE